MPKTTSTSTVAATPTVAPLTPLASRAYKGTKKSEERTRLTRLATREEYLQAIPPRLLKPIGAVETLRDFLFSQQRLMGEQEREELEAALNAFDEIIVSHLHKRVATVVEQREFDEKE